MTVYDEHESFRRAACGLADTVARNFDVANGGDPAAIAAWDEISRALDVYLDALTVWNNVDRAAP